MNIPRHLIDLVDAIEHNDPELTADCIANIVNTHIPDEFISEEFISQLILELENHTC